MRPCNRYLNQHLGYKSLPKFDTTQRILRNKLYVIMKTKKNLHKPIHQDHLALIMMLAIPKTKVLLVIHTSALTRI